jgi:hypothetical protein
MPTASDQVGLPNSSLCVALPLGLQLAEELNSVEVILRNGANLQPKVGLHQHIISLYCPFSHPRLRRSVPT